ncbi:MAG: efflux RND transporter periplasmic adaptor subunit [Calditrichaeota bacterium]|nr:efflux RND transporter periplasmic adaptor subunit [Calditrichota bacterium]HQU71082.1 efflux RND transporter periplasmic adaptor subunit [Calditrichia bacterium]
MLLILLAWGCNSDADQEQVEISIPVSAEKVAKGSIEAYVLTSGTLQAYHTAILYAEAQGRYRLQNNPQTGKPFQSGDKVKKGQTIVALENPEMIADVRLPSLKLELDISQREYEKQQSLYDKGGVTLRELKTAERTLMDAKFNVDNAQLQLAKLRLSAPFDGTLAELPFFSPGTEIATGAELAQVVVYEKLVAEVNFPAGELNRITPGQMVRVTQYSQPEDTLQGRITQVSPALDPETRSFRALVDIDNPNGIFRPGMFARLNVVVDSRENTIVIPREIILARREGPTVYIVDNGAASRRVLTLGLENPYFVEVESGLKEGDRVVTKGFETLRNRSRVKVVN